jgi:hypothetical protein
MRGEKVSYTWCTPSPPPPLVIGIRQEKRGNRKRREGRCEDADRKRGCVGSYRSGRLGHSATDYGLPFQPNPAGIY